MLASVVLLAALASVPSQTGSQISAQTGAKGAPRVLVLELEAVSVDKSEARSIDPLVLNAAVSAGGDVVSQSEIKKLAEVDAQKAELGCEQSSCLAELAGAMGTRFVLFGSVSKLGSTTTVSISLFDNSTATIARDSISVDDLGALPKELPPRVAALIAKARAPEATTSHSSTSASSSGTNASNEVEMPSALYYAGLAGVLLGGTAFVAGGLLATLNELTLQDPAALAGTKRNAQQNGGVGLLVGGVGVVLLGAGVAALVLE